VKRVVERPVESIETNVFQTAAVLRYAAAHRDAGAEPPMTLIASSSEVYGKSSKAPFSEDDDVVYGPTSVLRWSYACSKAIDEHLAIAHTASGRVKCAVVRLFNTVGPRQVGEYGMVLPNFVRSALAGEDLVVHGDGRQTRCFCDVRDVAPMLPRVLRESRCLGGVFNVGSDRPISIIDLAELVIRTLGSRSRTRMVSYESAFKGGVGVFEDLRQRQPDLTRLRAAVGFAPTIGLEQTIRDVADEIRAPRPGVHRGVSAEVG
jgi:UDP-glucose 4-epimerase